MQLNLISRTAWRSTHRASCHRLLVLIMNLCHRDSGIIMIRLSKLSSCRKQASATRLLSPARLRLRPSRILFQVRFQPITSRESQVAKRSQSKRSTCGLFKEGTQAGGTGHETGMGRTQPVPLEITLIIPSPVNHVRIHISSRLLYSESAFW
jgi:hypothetical protein